MPKIALLSASTGSDSNTCTTGGAACAPNGGLVFSYRDNQINGNITDLTSGVNTVPRQ
jgi:hypothetical protein